MPMVYFAALLASAALHLAALPAGRSDGLPEPPQPANTSSISSMVRWQKNGERLGTVDLRGGHPQSRNTLAV
jgi:hypothetical protein